MAVRHGYGKIAGTDALVFAYDTGDTRNSYKGEPTENLQPNAVPFAHGGYGNVVSVTDASSEKGPGWKKVTISTRGTNFRVIQWTYYSHTANKTYCHSAEFDWGNMRDKGYKIDFDGNGTGTRTYYRPGNYSSQGSTNIDSSMPDGVYAGVITHTQNHNHAFFIDNNTTDTSGLNDYFYYRNFQVEENTHPTQYTNGTRSATEGLKDLTGNSSIDLSNVSFDSNAQKTFDGTDDYINFAAGTMPNFGTGDFAIEIVFKMTKSNSYSHFYQVQDQYYFALKMSNANQRIYVYRTSALSTYNDIEADTTLGAWHHLVCQRSGDNIEMYLNGEYKGSKSGWGSIDIDGDTYDTIIGKYNNEYSQGEQPVTKIYNRVLTADEVRNNYRHYKKRFNI